MPDDQTLRDLHDFQDRAARMVRDSHDFWDRKREFEQRVLDRRVARLRLAAEKGTKAELPQDRPQTDEEIKGWKLARAMQLLSRGWSVPAIAEDVHVAKSTLYRWTDFRNALKRLGPGR